MMRGPVDLALIALLLPAGSFLVIGLLPPLRRSGRPAALFSIACACAAFVAALLGWRAAAEWANAFHATWPWLPGVNGPLATVGVLVDEQSITMLLLVTLVVAAGPGVFPGLSAATNRRRLLAATTRSSRCSRSR